MPFAGWSPIGIAALVAIVAGIVLLVVYAVQRGLLNRELEGMETEPGPGAEPEEAPPARPRRPAGPGPSGRWAPPSWSPASRWGS